MTQKIYYNFDGYSLERYTVHRETTNQLMLIPVQNGVARAKTINKDMLDKPAGRAGSAVCTASIDVLEEHLAKIARDESELLMQNGFAYFLNETHKELDIYGMTGKTSEITMEKTFKLISGNGGIFTVVKEYKADGFIPSVVGRNDKYRTVARVADIVWV